MTATIVSLIVNPTKTVTINAIMGLFIVAFTFTKFDLKLFIN